MVFGLLMGLTAWATAWFYFSGKKQVLANGPFCPADRLLFQMLVVSILLSFGSFLLVQGNFLFGLEPNHLALWAPPINIVLAVTTVLKSQ